MEENQREEKNPVSEGTPIVGETPSIEEATLKKESSPEEPSSEEEAAVPSAEDTGAQKQGAPEPLAEYAFRWSYAEDYAAGHKQEQKQKRTAVLLYTAIVISFFALAFAVLAVILAFSGKLTAGTPGTIAQQVSEKVVYVQNENDKNDSLATEAVAAKVVPSAVTVTVKGDQGSGVGSGVVYSSDGYIVTNSHVVHGMSSISVKLHDGRIYSAVLVGESTDGDLALLKVNATDLSPAEFGNSDDLLLGETVCAVGTPGGIVYAESVTKGIVSCKSRAVKVYNETTGLLDHTTILIQTDASVNPGNSGGALVNAKGEVIGIVVSKIVNFESSYHFYYYVEGMGFAIPSNVVVPAVESLKRNETPDLSSLIIKASRLGITGQAASAESGGQDGILVTGFTGEAFDAAKKFRVGDVILAVEGIPMKDTATLRAFLEDYAPGSSLRFTVLRDGTESIFEVILGSDDMISG